MSDAMKELKALISLHRYYIWANRLRDYFDLALEKCEGREIKNVDWADDFGLFMSHWYGALYIVIEGWNELGLHDEVIDSLLESSNVALLRRFRNGTFHFQKSYYDKKFTDFWEDSKDTVRWVRELNKEFGRYFLTEMKKRKEQIKT